MNGSISGAKITESGIWHYGQRKLVEQLRKPPCGNSPNTGLRRSLLWRCWLRRVMYALFAVKAHVVNTRVYVWITIIQRERCVGSCVTLVTEYSE